eukprot:2889489-Pleurochrysis_carterae.AAC.2
MHIAEAGKRNCIWELGTRISIDYNNVIFNHCLASEPVRLWHCLDAAFKFSREAPEMKHSVAAFQPLHGGLAE